MRHRQRGARPDDGDDKGRAVRRREGGPDRVARRRPEGVVLATWGLSPAEERLARGDVLAMSRVLEWPELLFT